MTSGARVRAESPPSGRLTARTVLPWAAFGVVLVVAFVFLLLEGRGNTFFYDEWSWIETRRSGLDAILSSYNQHMEVAPLAIYQLLFHTVGLAHYRYYRLLAALGHLACVVSVFIFARRRVGWLALPLIVPFAFFGAGWEFILWGLNFGFTTSIALCIAALVWLESDHPRRSAVGCAFLIAGLLFSETAVLFAAGVAVETTWRDRSLRRAWVWAIPAALYGAWWPAYYQPYLSEHDYGALPTFTAKLAANAAGGMFGRGPKSGWLVLAAIIVLVCVRLVRNRAFSPRLVGLAITLAAFWGLVAVGRAQLGDPGASRYIYTGAALLLLLVLESLRGVRVDRWSATAVTAVSALALIGNLRAFSPGEAELYVGSRSEAAELTALQLIRSRVPPGFVLDPHWGPQIIAAAYFSAVDALRSTPADSLSQLVRARESMRSAADDVLVRGGEIVIHPAPRLVQLAPTLPRLENQFVGRHRQAGRCLLLLSRGSGSTFDLTLPAGGLELLARPSGSTQTPPTDVRVRRFASGYENGPVAVLSGSMGIVISSVPDAVPSPWHVRVSPYENITSCSLRR